MSNLFRVFILALTPAIAGLISGSAQAHPGHPHVASSATHHGMEAFLVVLAAAAFAWSLRRAGVWGASKN